MIAVEGSWEGHPMGAFILDRTMFKQMVGNATAAKTEIPVDYEHQTFWAGMFGGKAPASGWINKLELRDGVGGEAQLWASIAWTNTAADHIRSREYRYLSPVIQYNSRDRKTGSLAGAVIPSVALTNVPFLEELPEVRLNSLPTFLDGMLLSEDETMTQEQLAKLCKILGLSESATPDEIAAMATKGSDGAALAASLLEALSLSADTPKDKALTAITVLKNPANDPVEVAALRTRVIELESDRVKREAKDLVALALTEGKLTAPGTAQHTWALGFASTNAAGFREWMVATPKVVPLDHKQPKPDELGSFQLDDDTVKACRDLGLSDEAIKKHTPAVAETYRRMS